MSIEVLFFGPLRDQAPAQWTAPDSLAPLTARALFAAAGAEFPGLPTSVGSIRAAINETYADWDAILNAGDTVAFLPPVSGG